MKKNITCLCGTNFQIEYEEEINIDNDKDSLNSIFNGTFMSFSCSYCAKVHKPEYKINIIWKSKNLTMEVIPELDRGEFYRSKKEDINTSISYETVIGFPEMADRLLIINDDLEPVVIETLKSFLLLKAAENYPDNDVDAWYHSKSSNAIEFHLDGIKPDEVAVMKIPLDMYEKTLEDYHKRPKNEVFTSLRFRSYLSVQNILRPDALK